MFDELVRDADVYIQNFRPGTADRLGVGRPRLQELNPALVYCSISGFGSSGPYVDRPSYDSVAQALSGFLSVVVDPERPRFMGPALADAITGIYAAQGVLGALVERGRTGRGRLVEVSMLEAMAHFAVEPFAAFFAIGEVPRSSDRPRLAQAYILRTGDGGLIAIHLSSLEKFWHGLTRAVDSAQVAGDPRFATRQGRIDNYEALGAALDLEFSRHPTQTWVERLGANDVPFAPIHRVDEVVADPQVIHLDLIVPVERAHGGARAVRPAIQFDGDRATHVRHGPVARRARRRDPPGHGGRRAAGRIPNDPSMEAIAMKASKLPSRLHHTAYVSTDLERTRTFYEDVIGLPLLAAWCESDELFGAVRTYCHLFFGLGDGGALAFFKFAKHGGPGAVRPQDAGDAVPSHRAQGGRRRADRHRGAAARGRLRGAADVRARARLLPLALRRRSGRHDRRVHRGPPGRREDQRRPARDRARRSQALAGRRPHVEQHLSLRGDRLRDQQRPHPHHARGQPAALAGGHRRAVRPREGSRARPGAARTFTDAVQEVVRRQVDAGVDVVSDGETSKISYATYIRDRLTGFAGDSPREPGQDLVEFPRILEKLARLGSTASYARPRCVGEIRTRSMEPVRADLDNLERAVAAARRSSRS